MGWRPTDPQSRQVVDPLWQAVRRPPPSVRWPWPRFPGRGCAPDQTYAACRLGSTASRPRRAIGPKPQRIGGCRRAPRQKQVPACPRRIRRLGLAQRASRCCHASARLRSSRPATDATMRSMSAAGSGGTHLVAFHVWRSSSATNGSIRRRSR